MSILSKDNQEKTDTIRSLVITSDSQYPWTPNMDERTNNESENEKKEFLKT